MSIAEMSSRQTASKWLISVLQAVKDQIEPTQASSRTS